MNRIHLYLSPTRDFDLINIMMNPAVDFNRLVKNALVNYVRGNVVYVDVPAKTNYQVQSNQKYGCYITFKDNEDDVFNFLQAIDQGIKGIFIKQVVRNSINGGLLDYYYSVGELKHSVKKGEIQAVPIQKKAYETRNKKAVQEELVLEVKPEAIPPIEEKPAITSAADDFDLFGQLALLGAAPH